MPDLCAAGASPCADPAAPRVLLVEDDADLRASLTRYLNRSGLQTAGIENGAMLAQTLAALAPEAVVLDINLPGEDGFALLERLRAHSRLGVVMLSARGTLDDRLRALTAGADFYLVKPVPPAELRAVLSNLIQRVRELAGSHRRAEQAVWCLDRRGWRLIAPDGTVYPLSGAEWAVIELLLRHPGTAVSRAELFAAMGKSPLEPVDRRLDVLISRLRAKCATEAQSLPVKAVRNGGYVFTGLARTVPDDRDAFEQ